MIALREGQNYLRRDGRVTGKMEQNPRAAGSAYEFYDWVDGVHYWADGTPAAIHSPEFSIEAEAGRKEALRRVIKNCEDLLNGTC